MKGWVEVAPYQEKVSGSIARRVSLLGCRFLDPKLGTVACGGEDSDEHIG